MIDQESELDHIYTSPLEEFIKLRNDLAGRLKKDDETEAAAQVAALKKPSVSAWVVNQLARTAQLELQRLIKAGEAIEAAQRRSISGAEAGGFADARSDEAAAITLLRTAAKKVSPSASPAVLDRVINTLRAGSATAEGREMIKQGRLTDDLAPPGFEAFSGLTAVEPVEKATTPRKKTASKSTAKLDSLSRRKAEAEENAMTLTTEAEDLEEEAAAAEELAKKAARAAARARKMADAAVAQSERLAAELAALERDS